MPRKSFPSFDKLLAATEETARLLALAERSVAIGGGLAMQFHGSPRLTDDVDLIALSADRLAWSEALSFGGVRGHASNGVSVDVIVREDEWSDLYRGALAESLPVDDSPIPVVTAEFLVPMKMVAGRPKDESDVLYLLQTEAFDFKAAESIVRDHLGAFGASEFKNIRRQAEWLRERER